MARLRSYVLKATYEWLLDHGYTPYFLVNALHKDVIVPKEYVEDGQIILNASAEANENMYFDDQGVSFDAGFDDDMMRVYLPLLSILALYAEETEQGVYTTDNEFTMVINEGDSDNFDPKSSDDTVLETKPKKGNLRFVKS
jgi:stringent starvation protein B